MIIELQTIESQQMPDIAEISPVSPWVVRFASLIPAGGEVLDLACGGGRHSRFLAARGYRVEAVDRNVAALGDLAGQAGVNVRAADLESGAWPYAGRRFAGIVVTNYLFRPRWPQLLAALDSPGVLLYETFMIGNERYGRPGNPEFLLQSQELLLLAGSAHLQVVAFEEGLVEQPRPALVQRLCARRA